MTTITNSPNAIINWQNFSIAQNELTRFVQENGQSAVLNRIIGQNPSEILGQLASNGKVFLINPNGIVFGAGATVDTQGLIASSLNLSDQDFLNGNYHFIAGSSAGNIVNEGIIRAGKDGNVILIAPQIQNNGIIKSDGGSITLAAGQELTITNLDNPDIRFQIQAPTDSALNLGKLLADGGAVNVFASTIKHSGEISADSVEVDAQGNIRLVAQHDVTLTADSKISANNSQGDAGTVHIESKTGTTLAQGTIEAQATQSGKGGKIDLLGEQVGVLDKAKIDASGENGGGQVLVGGDYQGKNAAVHNAKANYIGQETTIKADAKTHGDGGKVVAWSDNTTRAYGNISARGGQQGGDGGLVEVSGKQHLTYQAHTDTQAPQGKTGTLLLDPTNIWIDTDQSTATGHGMIGSDASADTVSSGIFAASGSVSDSLLTTVSLVNALGTSSVIVQTNNASGSGAGNITVGSAVSWATVNSLKLFAQNDISVNANIDATGGGNLTLMAGWNSASGTTNPSTITGTGNVAVANGVTAHGSSLYASAGNNITSAGTGQYTGYVYLKAGGNINLTLDGDFTAATTTDGKSISIKDPGALVISSQGISTVNGNVSLNPSGSSVSSIGGPINLGTGILDLNSTASTTYSIAAGTKLSAGTINLASYSTLSGQGNLFLETDNLSRASANSISSAGSLSIAPKSLNRNMQIGGANPGGVLFLSDFLNLSPSGSFELGSDSSSYTGTTTIAGAISNPPSALTIRAGGTGSSGNLIVSPGASIANTSNNADTVSLKAGNNIIFGDTAASSASTSINIGNSGTGTLLVELKPGNQILTNQYEELNLGGSGSDTAYTRMQILDGKTWDHQGTLNLLAGSSVRLGDSSLASRFDNNGTVNINTGAVPFWSYDNSLADGQLNNFGTMNILASSAFIAKFKQSATGILNINTASAVLTLPNLDDVAGHVNLNDAKLLINENRTGSNRRFSSATITETGTGSSSIEVSGTGVDSNHSPIATFTNVTATTVPLTIGANGSLQIADGNSKFKTATLGGNGLISMSSGSLNTAYGDFSVPSGVTYSGTNIGYMADGGNLTVASAISKSDAVSSSLLLAASGNVIVNAPITATTNPMSVTLQAHNTNNTGPGNVQIKNNITTNGGNLVVGGGTDASTISAIGDCCAQNGIYGIYIQNASIDTGGGNITMHGQAYNYSVGGGLHSDGIHLDSTASLLSGSGNVQLVGKAGNDPTGDSSGVYIGGTVHSTGSGSVTLNGSGGTNTNGANIQGVRVQSGSVSTVNGPLSVTGIVNATNSTSAGVQVDSASASVSSSGTGSISILGNAGMTNGYGVSIFDGGSVSTSNASAGISVRADSLNLVGGGSQISGADFVELAPVDNADMCISVSACAGVFTINPVFGGILSHVSATGPLVLGRAVADTGYTGTLTVKSGTPINSSYFNGSKLALNGNNVVLENGSSIGYLTAFTKSLDILANNNATVSGSIYSGSTGNVLLRAGNAITVNSAITTLGQNVILNADADGNNGGNIVMNGGASISSGGGYIAMGGSSCSSSGCSTSAAKGYGTANRSESDGIYFNGSSGSGVTLNSGGGNIWLYGQGVNDPGTGSSSVGHKGIEATYLSLNSGTGSIYIKGNGGSGLGYGQGIYIGASSLTSQADIALLGTGSASATGTNNSGISLFSTTLNGGTNNTNSIAMSGTGGSGTDLNNGIFIGVDAAAGTRSNITTTGTLTMSGTGGGSGTGISNEGIGLESATLTAAVMNLTGTGGSGTNSNNGIDAWAYSSGLGGSQMTSTGSMTLIGTGGAAATGSNNVGISLYSATLNSGSDSMILNGTGGSGTNYNYGVYLSVDNLALTRSTLTTTGALSIIGTGGSGSGFSNKGIGLKSAQLNAAQMTLNGTGGSGTDSNRGIDAWASSALLGGSQLTSTGSMSLTGTGGTAATGNDNIGIDLFSATLNSGASNMSLFGTGGSGTASNYGVYLSVDALALTNTSLTTTGSLTITGTGGAGTISANKGIGLLSAHLSGGTMNLTGTGGSGTDYNIGIDAWAFDGTRGNNQLSSTGNMTVTGNGRTTAVTGSYNHGASFANTVFQTSGGTLSVSGQGGISSLNGSLNFGLRTFTSTFSSGAGNLTMTGRGTGAGYGLDINNGSVIGGVTGQTGLITLIADTDSGSDSIQLATAGTNPIIQGTGSLILKPLNDTSDTGLLGGTGVFNLSATELDYIQDGFSCITIGNSTGTGSILYGNSSNTSYTFKDSLVLQGYDITLNDSLAIGSNSSNSGSLTLQGNNQVILANNANLTTYGQNITLNSDRDSDGFGSIEVSSSSINSNGGNITLGGGTSPSTTAAYGYPGIQISNATINAGTGNLSIRGAGITGASFGTTGIDIYSSQLSTSGTGNISLNGAAGNWTDGNFGVKLNNGMLTAGGAINIDSSGLGSGSNTKGVYLFNTQVTNNGTINITASGTGTAADLFQSDGWISNRGSDRTTTGSNDITLSGSNLTLHDVRSQHHIVLNATGDVGLNTSAIGSDYVDDDYFVYNLPFAFTFFGTSYSQAYISSNGLITFGTGTIAYSDSISNLASYKAIAPAWNDWVLRTSSDKNIFISQPTVGSNLAVKWNVNRYASETNTAVFEAVLNSSGNITFNYGAASSSFANDVTIGLSDGSTAIGSQLMAGFTSLNNLYSTTFTPSGGSYTETVSGSGGVLASTTPIYTGTSGFNIGNSTVLTALSNVSINAANTITQYGQIESSNGGNIVLSAGSSYVNNVGSNAFSVSGSGRWLIYSPNPANNTLNGLTPTFKHYNCQSATSCTGYSIPATGNGLLYSIAPQLLLTPGSASTIYGDSANLSGLNYTLTGSYIDGDTSASVSGTANFSTDATTTSPVGSYAISYSGGLTSSLGYTIVNSSSSGLLSITPRALTVTADNFTRVFNAENPVFTGKVTAGSLANSDTLGSIGLSFTTLATKLSNLGTYAITPQLSNNNYKFTGVDGFLTITSNVLKISANAANKVYGDPDPVFTYSYNLEGVANSNSLSNISFTGALSRDPGETVAGGPYAIKPGNLAAVLDNTSYAIDFIGANFTIKPATLSIVANDLTKVYGEAIPTLTATATGLKNGDTNAIITGLTTLADIKSGIGKYTIDASNASAGSNYTIASTANGNLTINPALLNIAANALSKTYGDPDPVFTYTASGFVNGDSSSILTGALSRAAGETVAGGPYAINQGSLNSTSNNYLLRYQGANLTVTPRPLNVVASDASKDYGDPDPIFAYTATGFANGDSSSILTGALSREPGETVSGGPYDILQGSLSGGGNYNINYTEGHLTIKPSLINGSENSTGSTVTESVENVSSTVISTIAQQSSGTGRDIDGSNGAGGMGGPGNSGDSRESGSSGNSDSTKNSTGGSTNANGSSSSKTGKGKNAKECTK
ncbi:MAG: MBG domain-containing protein [Methylobacter sp.]